MQMYTFVRFSVVISETPSKKAAVILSHLYVIGLKIVLREGARLQYFSQNTHCDHDPSPRMLRLKLV